MNELPKDNQQDPASGPESIPVEFSAPQESPAAAPFSEAVLPAPAFEFAAQVQPAGEQPLFFTALPPDPPPARIPHIGHLMLLIPFVLFGMIVASVVLYLSASAHLFGVASLETAMGEIHYMLGFEVLMYLFAFLPAMLVFPLFWRKEFFPGVQWNGATALRLSGWLIGAAFLCFVLALLNGILMPGPSNAPIEKVFRAPGAAWLMFFFGISFAPFFEEMLFRGFLLPSLCTAWDWATEKSSHTPPLPLGEGGHPQWSLPAMIAGSIVTSLCFAGIHLDQQGHSLGPFLLIVAVSLVLCAVRLTTRSLAASILVHSCYNFLLFSLMIIGTSGFRHLDKL
jgi:hypothetical protein